MLKSRVPDFVRRMERIETRNLRDAGKILLEKVKEEISTQGGGKPSPPGSPPARPRGKLIKSYKTRVRKMKGGEKVSETGSTHFTSRMLEKGTEKMAPRPHLQRAMENNHDEILKPLKRKWF